MTRKKHWLSGAWVLLFTVLAGTAVHAEDAFYSVRVADVELTEGKLPEYQLETTGIPPQDWRAEVPAPYAALDGDGEALVQMENRFFAWSFTQQNLLEAEILVRVPAKREITGRLYLPTADMKAYTITRFRIPADSAKPAFQAVFYQAKVNELESLLSRNVPGGAWFRHELREARRQLNQVASAVEAPRANQFLADSDLDDTYALFSGGRALSENLALERDIAPSTSGSLQQTVELSKIEGITIAEIDWTKLIEGKTPELDPLAKQIPADQHAVFFPSFDAYVAAMDELRGNSAPVLTVTEPRAEDARTIARYEKQLGVPLTAAARLFGGSVVKSVALTGGDPYFRVGTDVGFVFETSQPAALKQLLWGQMKMSAQGSGAQEQNGKTGSVEYSGLRSDDRRVSGYVAVLPGAVLLTNSPYQIERAAEVADGTAPALASLPEFVFFRDRYPRGAEGETAFVFLSDATIRRWCGPHWRIASSRRTRDVAVVAEMQATYLERLVRHEVKPGPIYTDLAMVSAGELMLEESGVRSPVYNTLEFQTPISELQIDKVTEDEQSAYERWRDGYQRNWRWAFDPIGIRLTLTKETLAADMTVMPLIGGSDYQQFIAVTRGAKIPAGAGDPHDTMLHYIMAINREALPVRQYAGLATAMAPGAKVDVLAWLGDTISVYCDRDPFWAELMNPELDNQKREELLRSKGYAVPLAVRIDSRSNLQLAAFLTGVRAFVEQTAPGLTAWESLKHQDFPYVKIGPTRRAGAGVPENSAIYYGVVGDALVVTPNEGVLTRAIDRELARQKAAESRTESTKPEWLGESIALRADRAAAEAPLLVGIDQYRNQVRRLSWNNLPILNEWHRLFPDEDPVKLHETYWQTKLVCPGGGEYVWNEEYQTMESTVFGSPANPKMEVTVASPLSALERGEFGLTFEEQGLRAKAQLERAVK